MRDLLLSWPLLLLVGLSAASCGREPTCTDGLYNGSEEAVDCGGSCGACDAEASCDDGVRNGNESDLDCGGSCEPCDVLEGCVTGADCIESVCTGGTCREASCDDGVPNGDESDEDCGGDCDLCEAGSTCTSRTDCIDGVCKDDECQEPTCSDNVKNGDETDKDCGGDCDACEPGQACAISDDCAGSLCLDDVCLRAITVRGTAKASGSVVGVYVAQNLVRVDFASPPTVTGFDGEPITLNVSSGGYVGSPVSDPFEGARLTVNGVELTNPTGQCGHQSQADISYHGITMYLDSEASATTSFNALTAAALDGKAVEILLFEAAP